jgi:RecJ-like exonuclease
MIDLTIFCAKERTRYNLETPFVIEGYEYFSDGRICIKRKTDKPNTTDKAPDFEDCFDLSKQVQLENGIEIKLPDLSDDNCPYCRGTGKEFVECDECSGTGNCTCDCGHEHECPSCDGEGTKWNYSENKCPVCDGLRKAYSDVMIDKAKCKGYYIAMICKNLDLPVAVSFSKSALDPKDYGSMRFLFDGGEGILMSIKQD